MSDTQDVSSAGWRLHALADLHWRRWDDEWAVFDVGSGQTHCLDTISAVAVLLLEGATGVRFGDLAMLVSEQLGVASSPELISVLAGAFHRLSTVGLLERVP